LLGRVSELPPASLRAPRLRASALARYLFGAYAVLVVYASLHPFSGWQIQAPTPFAFLTAPLPRSITRFDLVTNILGYIPLGFLAVLAAYPRLRAGKGLAFGIACSVILSFILESLQMYLPSRTSSNVDLLANALGGTLGALLALPAAPKLLGEGALKALRYRLLAAGPKIDLGVVLVGLWLLSQMSPETLLFGAGDLRELFQPPPGKLYPPEVFLRVEAAIAAANTIAIGLFVSCLTRRAGPARLLFCALVAVALSLRWTAFDVLMKDMLWITPGALTGLAAGVLVVLAGISLPRTARLAVAGLALMGATALVNLSPGNPYMAASLALWQRGAYFNFNGLTHIVSAAWPFAAMFYLVFLAADRGRENPQS
jgi:VanZ family protein